jgi:hypothetical protein
LAIDINFGALQTPNPFGALQDGIDAGQKMRQQQALQQAGNLFSTDPDKAAAVLAPYDIEGAARVQQLGAARKQAASRAKAMQLAASGDFKGAQTEALADPEMFSQISKLDEQTKAALHEQESTIASLGYSLAPLPYEQRRARLAEMAANPPAGIPAEALTKFDPTDENIRSRVGTALGVAKMIELSKPQEMDPNKSYYQSDLAGGPGSAPQGAQPPQAQPASAPAPTQASGGAQPRGVRNNNPLNVTTLGGGQNWNGQTGADGHYAVFDSPEAGFAAADKNLTAYATKHGINTISGVISRWAPSSENDTQSYIGTVSRDLGVDPNQPLDLSNPQVRHAVLTSMSKVELGQSAPQAQPYQVASAGATPPPPSMPGYHLLQAAHPVEKWTSDGKGNLVNVNGDRKIDPTYEGAGTADPNVVKMILEGRYPVPTGRAATDPKWQAALAAAAAQDPNFNAADYHTRYSTRQSFTGQGKNALNITAINTSLGHIGELASKIDGLGNTPFPAVNSVKNWFETSTGDNRVTNFDTDKKAVASELVRVFRQAGGAESDVKDFQKQLDAAQSPEQLKGATQEMVKLLTSRLDSLAEQYKNGLGQEKSGIEFLTPKAQKVYSRVMGVPVDVVNPRGSGQSSATSQTSPGRPPAAAPNVIRYDAQGNRIK